MKVRDDEQDAEEAMCLMSHTYKIKIPLFASQYRHFSFLSVCVLFYEFSVCGPEELNERLRSSESILKKNKKHKVL